MATTKPTSHYKKRGFTIVEIIVVLVILALLVVGAVPFLGRAQADARDDRRETDIAAITAALERYYQDNGEYPRGEGSSVINGSWSTTADNSWDQLSSKLVPKYINELPGDPSGETGKGALSRGLAYDYYANSSKLYSSCGKEARQTYILLYNFEGRGQKITDMGECVDPKIGLYSGASNYRVARDNT